MRALKAISLSASALLLAATACAHARPAPAPTGVRVAGTEFTLAYGPEDEDAARQVARALRDAAPIAARWGGLPPAVRVTIHPTHGALEAATRREGHAWLRAWARPSAIDLQSPRTWSRGEASDPELAQLLAHELTHVVMYRWAGGEPGHGRTIPLWFREGMASVTAGDDRPLSHDALWRFYGAPVGARRGDPLTDPGPLYREQAQLVYGTADRAFRFLVERHGEERVRTLLGAMSRGRPFADAFSEAIGVPVAEFEGAFRAHVLDAAGGQS